MKRILLICTLLLLLVPLLAGCRCEHDWVEATCTEARRCRLCGERQGRAPGHNWEDATCEQAKTCSACGATDGKPLEHNWLDATCTAGPTCSMCGLTKDVALEHHWLDATCDQPKTCSLCGATEGEAPGHSWVDATCTTAKVCSICSTTSGKPLGHSWLKATCTTPQKCMTCGIQGSNPVGHEWLDATCFEPLRCAYCEMTNGEPLEHIWLDATPDTPKTCQLCGTTDGFPIEEDDRFVREDCLILFGQWQGTLVYTAADLNIPSFDGQHTERITYRFGEYGLLYRTTEVVDVESYKAMLAAEMAARTYAAQAEEYGRDAEAADAYWLDLHGMTIPEYSAKLVEEDITEEEMNFTEELVYYIADGLLYIAPTWQDDAGFMGFQLEGDQLTLSDEFAGDVLVCTRLPEPTPPPEDMPEDMPEDNSVETPEVSEQP